MAKMWIKDGKKFSDDSRAVLQQEQWDKRDMDIVQEIGERQEISDLAWKKHCLKSNIFLQ